MAGPLYIPGDYKRVCDVCGFVYRASTTFKRWDGLITCSQDWEPRHPQDFVRGRTDRQNVPEPRSEPVITVIGPLTTTITAAAVAGATTISVASSTRFLAADHIGILLDGGDLFRVVIQSVPSTTSLLITNPLPGVISIGNAVTNYSVVSEPSL